MSSEAAVSLIIVDAIATLINIICLCFYCFHMCKRWKQSEFIQKNIHFVLISLTYILLATSFVILDMVYQLQISMTNTSNNNGSYYTLIHAICVIFLKSFLLLYCIYRIVPPFADSPHEFQFSAVKITIFGCIVFVIGLGCIIGVIIVFTSIKNDDDDRTNNYNIVNYLLIGYCIMDTLLFICLIIMFRERVHFLLGRFDSRRAALNFLRLYLVFVVNIISFWIFYAIGILLVSNWNSNSNDNNNSNNNSNNIDYVWIIYPFYWNISVISHLLMYPFSNFLKRKDDYSYAIYEKLICCTCDKRWDKVLNKYKGIPPPNSTKDQAVISIQE